MRLVTPQSRFIKSYLRFCHDYKKNGLNDFAITGRTITELAELLGDESQLAAATLPILSELVGLRAPPKKNQPPCSAFWLVNENGDVNAIGSVRHCLSPALELFGGHIGYGVRIGCWNRGFGTEILRLLLPEAARLGIKHALLTCDIGNAPSLRVMEKNGGKLLDMSHQVINGFERFANRILIDTGLELNRRFIAFSHTDLNRSMGNPSLNLIPVKTIDEGGLIQSHYFRINVSGKAAGWIVFRAADEPRLYFDGNIGYFIDAQFRRRGLATAACMLLTSHLKNIGIRYVYITCDSDNIASRIICDRLGAKLLEIAVCNTGVRNVIKCRYLLEL